MIASRRGEPKPDYGNQRPRHLLDRVGEGPAITTELYVGDDVYVRDPQATVPGCISITGPITAIDGETYTVDAYIVLGAYAGGFKKREITLPLNGVGQRLGTPISTLSGRPGIEGFVAFARIARSWGYP